MGEGLRLRGHCFGDTMGTMMDLWKCLVTSLREPAIFVHPTHEVEMVPYPDPMSFGAVIELEECLHCGWTVDREDKISVPCVPKE